MRKVKWSFLVLLLLAITTTESADAAGLRRFYLTKATFDGGTALEACNNGYHTASLWEIYDFSNLRYERTLGLSNTDSGFGPPTATPGWIRTGYSGNPFGSAGLSNCLAYSINLPSYSGTVVEIPADWGGVAATKVGLWNAGTSSCGSHNHVWCVQN